MVSTNIIEIFSSVQGEGPYIGCRQVFIRFAGCNLSCEYCDTPFEKQEYCSLQVNPDSNKFNELKNPVSQETLLKEISGLLSSFPHHSISLTGGEPLLNSEFLMEFLPEFRKCFPKIKIYLETNGTLFKELEKVIKYTDIISMDLKIKSSTGVDFPIEEHKKFIQTARKFSKEIFTKAVISSKIQDSEINEISELLRSFDEQIILVLQPVTSDNEEILLSPSKILEIQEKFMKKLNDVRVIPQTHKLLDLL